MTRHYDRIGHRYRVHRTTDPQLAAAVASAVGDGRRVLNVGAGTGSYEPSGRRLVAVEPSAVMLGQRPPGSAPAVQAVAEALPLAGRSFDVATAVLTVHHWDDVRTGLRELRRVAGRAVVLTFDPGVHRSFWLFAEYLPEAAVGPSQSPPPPEAIAGWLGGARIETVPIPADCRDGFTLAFWRRPHAYLDPAVRAGCSSLAELPADLVAERMAVLAGDLASGCWEARHGALRSATTYDGGLRLVVTP
ncbi:MAG: class I SAM-dependent methyltransferase [Acidimicrobiales bacterium]